MKKIIIVLMLILFSAASVDAKDTWVNGYTKKNGTSVQGHYRSSPDSRRNNNYSTYGNTNPYSGKRGTRTFGGTCTTSLNC